MKTKLRLGIIGAGAVVREIYQHLYFHSRYSDMLEICAVADPNEQYRNWFSDLAGVPPSRRFTNHRDLLAKVKLDAVQVNTPDNLHCGPTVDAFKAGLDVVVPKPTAATVKDAHAMIQAARKSGRYLGIDFHKREDPRIKEAEARFQNGRYGTLQTAVFYMLDKLVVVDPNHTPRFFASPDFAEKNTPVSFLTVHMADALLKIVNLIPVQVRATGYSQKLPSLKPIPVKGYDLVDTEILFETGAHQIGNLAFVNLRRAESIDQHANRFSDSNGVGKLHFTAISQSGGNNVLGNVARHVAGRAVNLGRVFAAECATAMASHATVGVHDDLAAGQPGVAHGTTDYEASRWVDVVLGVLVQHLLGQRGLDHILQDVSAQLLGRNRLRVLTGDDHCINAHRLVVLVVFHCDLGFAVGPEVRKGAILADCGELLAQLVGQRNCRRHVIGIFVGGIAEHHTLVARAAGVHAHGNVTRLLVDAGDDRAGIGIEPVEGVVIADGGDHAAHQRLEIHVSFGGNFAGNDNQAGGRQGLARHAAVGIFLHAGIEDCVRNLIVHFVRLAFGRRLGRKQIILLGQSETPSPARCGGPLRVHSDWANWCSGLLGSISEDSNQPGQLPIF